VWAQYALFALSRAGGEDRQRSRFEVVGLGRMKGRKRTREGASGAGDDDIRGFTENDDS